MASTRNTAVARTDEVQDPFLYDISAQQQTLIENLGDDAVFSYRDLYRVKMPAGGSIAWMIPTEDEAQPEMTQRIEGVIIASDDQRAYFANGYTGEALPPDCKASAPEWKGSVEFNGKFGGDCATCPLNQWVQREDGSYAPKPCKINTTIYVLRPDDLLPIAIKLPTTSIPDLKKYFAGMQRCKPKQYPFMVVTAITLKQAKNKGGIPFSMGVYSKVRVLDAKEITEVVKYGKLFEQFRSRKPLMLDAPNGEIIDADALSESNLGTDDL